MAVLTAPDAWIGGFMELALYYPNRFPLQEPLAAIWSYPGLSGPVASRTPEVAEQAPVDLASLEDQLQADEFGCVLYGAVELPGGGTSACLTDALRFAGGEELLTFCIPLGSLEAVWPGASVFEFPDQVPRLNELFVALAHHVFSRARFRRGLVGFELDADEPLREPGAVPDVRLRPLMGVLDVQGDQLVWHPPAP